MQNKSHYRPLPINFSPHLFFEGVIDETDDPWPDVPILRATREQLECLLQEPALDLRAMSEVILDDLGATLQILRLIGKEYAGEDERPVRIGDCIASLNAAAWFPAVCSAMLVKDTRALGVWKHARRIAHSAEQMAAREQALRPGEARLVGLLHELGRIPGLLGWQNTVDGIEEVALGMLLAEQWRLPGYVLEAIWEQGQVGGGSQWVELLDSAHVREEQEAETWQAETVSAAILCAYSAQPGVPRFFGGLESCD